MDSGRIIGLFILSGLVVASILLGGPFIAFVDTKSLLFVVGVTFSAAFVSVPGERLMECLGPDLMKAGGSVRNPLERAGVFDRLAELALAAGVLGSLMMVVEWSWTMPDLDSVRRPLTSALLPLFYGYGLSRLIFRSFASHCRQVAAWSTIPISRAERLPMSRWQKVGMVVYFIVLFGIIFVGARLGMNPSPSSLMPEPGFEVPAVDASSADESERVLPPPVED